MPVPERLLLRCGDRFAAYGGKVLHELSLDVERQDPAGPVCAAATALSGEPGVLTIRITGPLGRLSVFDLASRPADVRALDAVAGELAEHEVEALQAKQGPPWMRPGFHAELLDFARRAGGEFHGVETVRVSPLSCIYRLAGEAGHRFVKATRPGAFVPEGAVMRRLHAAFPELVPGPLAVDGMCTLFADFGERMGPTTAAPVLAAAAAGLARMQVEGGALLDEPGLQSWRLVDLPRDLRSCECVGPEFLERVERAVAELSAFGIGDRLVHGDFYWGNLALADGAPRIFDWSDAGVGHPFFDPMEAYLSDDPERRETVRAAYLSVWRRALDVDVDEAWRVAVRLAPAHHLARNDRLLSCLEPWERPTLEPDRAFWARRALEALAA